MQSINPATNEVFADYPELTAAEIDSRVRAAAETFEPWSRRSFDVRAACMRRAGDVLRRRREELGRLITLEMGKPVAAAEAEVEKCAWVCDYYAQHAASLLAPQAVETEARKSYVRYDPLGVILAVMPWNFPFWQFFRFAAPGLMAGNTALLKHASNVPGCALAIAEVFRQAEFPADVMSTLLISGRQALELIARQEIRAVTLTGSDQAGVAIATAAGAQVKKCVLELGGSDPFLVLADADPLAAARLATRARTINNGQSCIAAKRFIVVEGVADAFEQAMVEAMRSLSIGDPLDRATELGPLARPDLVDALDELVQRSVRQGAHLATGGTRPERPGSYYAPTVLTGVVPGMAVFDEETFGPVAAITRARDAAHAVELANRSRYGLGATICTRDLAAAEALAPHIASGMVFVNEIVKSDPRLPFGGVKSSGYGRELADVGIREWTNIKTVWIAG